MKKKYVILIIAAVFIIGIIFTAVVIFSGLEKNLSKLSSMSLQNIDLSQIEDGIYTGSYNAFPVAAEVSVNVKDHKIESIELVKHDNGQGAPAEVITGEVVKAQSLQVDIIAGCTYSSIVILKAIENALITDINQ